MLGGRERHGLQSGLLLQIARHGEGIIKQVLLVQSNVVQGPGERPGRLKRLPRRWSAPVPMLRGLISPCSELDSISRNTLETASSFGPGPTAVDSII